MKIQLQSTSQMIDHVALRQFDDLHIDGMPDILVETIDSFFTTSPERISLISTLKNSQDIKGVTREAHALKSSSMILGAVQLGNLCQQLEDLSGPNALSELEQLHKSLVECYKLTCSELTEIKKARISGVEKNP